MLETFGATFFGVIASFSLWYFGTWYIQHSKDKQARSNILEEIRDEIKFNITTIDSYINSIPKSRQEGNIPGALSARLSLSVYHYAITNRELRLLSKQQRLTLNVVARISESTNEFINNTETLLGIWQLKPHDQALGLASYRLSNLIEDLKEKRTHLQAMLDSL